jgi:hypothetical protein
MNIKLRLMSIWVPGFILKHELDRVKEITNKHLGILLDKYGIESPKLVKVKYENIDMSRKIMAADHNLLVKSLIDSMGYQKALEVGRKEMFKAGYELGSDAKKRLGVGSKIEDAVSAAGVLYQVLGIKFTVEESGTNIILKVKSCALASHYTPETCKIMSATDEGVLKGLNNKMSMKFTERITEGSHECRACIKVNETSEVK